MGWNYFSISRFEIWESISNISSQTLLGMWLLIHAEIKVSKMGPVDAVCNQVPTQWSMLSGICRHDNVNDNVDLIFDKFPVCFVRDITGRWIYIYTKVSKHMSLILRLYFAYIQPPNTWAGVKLHIPYPINTHCGGCKNQFRLSMYYMCFRSVCIISGSSTVTTVPITLAICPCYRKTCCSRMLLDNRVLIVHWPLLLCNTDIHFCQTKP